MTAADIYRLRGGVLHLGDFAEHAKSEFVHIVFFIPHPELPVLHINVAIADGKKVLQLHPIRFCHEVIAAARRWYDKNKDRKEVKTNLLNLVRYRPNGLKFFNLPLSGS
jgi:hypothetical protein